MNCLEFRRTLSITPLELGSEMVAHRDRCPTCAAAAVEAEQLEARLAGGFDVAPPKDLYERILNELGDPADDRPQRLWWWQRSRVRRSEQPPGTRMHQRWGVWTITGAAAASLVLAVGMVLVLAPAAHDHSDRRLRDAIVAHINEEMFALTANGTIEAAELEGTLQPIGLGLRGAPTGVRFAMNCKLRGRLIAHWVLEGKRAPVTILLMPEETIAETTRFDNGPLRGVILPSRNGSIAILGARGEDLEPLMDHVAKALDWSA